MTGQYTFKLKLLAKCLLIKKDLHFLVPKKGVLKFIVKLSVLKCFKKFKLIIR